MKKDNNILEGFNLSSLIKFFTELTIHTGCIDDRLELAKTLKNNKSFKTETNFSPTKFVFK